MSLDLALPTVEDLPAPLTKEVRASKEIKELIAADVDIESAVLDIVNRKKLDFNAVHSVLEARIRETMTGAPTFVLTIHDPDLYLLNSDVLFVLDKDGDMVLQVIDIEIDDHPFRLVGCTWDDASEGRGVDIVLTFEHRIVSFLREHNRPLKISRKRITLAEFMYKMAREVKETRIRFISPHMHRQNPLASPSKSDSKKLRDSNREPGLGDDVITVKGVKATPKQRRVIDAVLRAGEARNAKTKLLVVSIMVITQESGAGVANRNKSNPNVVGPFQQDGSYGSEAQRMDPSHAADEFFKRLIPIDRKQPNLSYADLAEAIQRSGNGSAYEAWHDEATKTVKAFGGTGTESIAYYKTVNYTRGVDGKKENSWDCSQRYAQLINMRSFVSGIANWYWISEPDLFKSRSRMTIYRGHPAVLSIGGEIDRGKKASTLTLKVRVNRWVAPAGSIITVEGEGGASGRWLVEDIERSLFSPDADITLKKPTKPKPEPRGDLVTTTDDVTGTGSVAALYKACQKISDAGGPYVYGGGHGPPLDSLNPKDGLDCSSSTSLALHDAGLFEGHTTAIVSGDFSTWGKPGQGKYFTVWYNGEHVWIEFHGVGKAKRFDTSPHGSGGPGPRMRYVARSTAGFSPRHIPEATLKAKSKKHKHKSPSSSGSPATSPEPGLYHNGAYDKGARPG